MRKKANVIVISHLDGRVEAWGSLLEICRKKGFSYHTLKTKSFPFEHEDWRFSKVSYREESIHPNHLEEYNTLKYSVKRIDELLDKALNEPSIDIEDLKAEKMHAIERINQIKSLKEE